MEATPVVSSRAQSVGSPVVPCKGSDTDGLGLSVSPPNLSTPRPQAGSFLCGVDRPAGSRDDVGVESSYRGQNKRVRDVEIRFSSGASLHTTLQDKADGEVVTLNQPVASKWVQVVILSVYPGWNYSDTAINELQVDAR